MAHQGGSMQQRYNKQNALLAKQVESGDGLYHMMASATLTRGRDLFLCGWSPLVCCCPCLFLFVCFCPCVFSLLLSVCFCPCVFLFKCVCFHICVYFYLFYRGFLNDNFGIIIHIALSYFISFYKITQSGQWFIFYNLISCFKCIFEGVRQLAMPVMGGARFVVVDSGKSKTLSWNW